MAKTIIKIALASQNPPKARATKSAFSRLLSAYDIKLDSYKSDSKVSSHPLSAEESIKGALNRIENIESLVIADYYVGIEGGLLKIDSRYFELGYVAIKKDNEVHIGLSAAIELSGTLLAKVLSGIELSLAIEQELGLADLGKASGFYGLTTNELITREKAYEDAIIFALAPFINNKYFR